MIQHEVDRCQMDGNFWSDLRSGRTIFQDRVDRRSTVKKVVVQLCLNALPLFTHPKGGPGVGWFFALLGFPVFGIGS